MTPCRVLYVINGFNKGGAEIGLRTMLEHGFLKGCDVRVIGLHEGAPELRAAIGRLVGPDNLVLASDRPKLTLAALRVPNHDAANAKLVEAHRARWTALTAAGMPADLASA